jgi:hypothetical protein
MLNLLLCDSVTFSPFSLRQRELFSLCGSPFPSAALCDHPLPTQSTLQTQSKNQLNQPFDQHLTSSTSETTRALTDVPKTQNSRVVSGEQPEPYKAFKTYKKANTLIFFTSLVCLCISCMVQFYTRVSNKCLPPSRL